MKKNLFSLLSMVVMLMVMVPSVLMTSCVSDEIGGDNPDQPTRGTYWIKDTVPQFDVNYGKYNALRIEYVTLSANGVSLEKVSGLVTIPADQNSTVAIVIDNHFTITANSEAPSVCYTTATSQFAGSMFCVVSTDYVGYGITKNEKHPYLNSQICAVHSIDLARIARHILWSHGVKVDPIKTVNIGYSQGGAVALGVHRILEATPTVAQELNFLGSWCGDGPYDVAATVKSYLANTGEVAYPVAMPLLVEGLLASASSTFLDGAKFEDFFTDQMNKAGLKDMLSSRMYNTDYINEKMHAVVGDKELTVSDIFSTGMSSVDGPLMKKYLKFAEANDLTTGWKPSAKYNLRLFHLEDDQVVPIVNLDNAIKGLELKEENYKKVANPTGMSHGDYGQVFYVEAATEIIVALAK